MKIVIDIPAEDFEAYKMQVKTIEQEGIYYESSNYELKRLIANGTPLPKGHGDLIDRNSILCDDYSCEQCGHADECFKLLAPTIIEACKAESEYKEIKNEN